MGKRSLRRPKLSTIKGSSVPGRRRRIKYLYIIYIKIKPKILRNCFLKHTYKFLEDVFVDF